MSTDDEIIRPLDRPLVKNEAIAILTGNLAPQGAAIKLAAATPALFKFEGPALVFSSLADLEKRFAAAPVRARQETIELASMVRPPDGQGSAAARMVELRGVQAGFPFYGTVVLHVCPEAAVGGTLALVQNGDFVEMDVEARILRIDVSDGELATRRAKWKAPEPAMKGGYQGLYVEHVQQANTGCDMDFLVGCRGSTVKRESH